jgi:DNA-binding IclR family transcriptional regulator
MGVTAGRTMGIRGDGLAAPASGARRGERVQAVARTLAILDEMGCYPGGSTPKALAATLGLSVGTVYRLLNTLSAGGYVVRDPELGVFLLGHRIPLLNAALVRSLHVPPRLCQCVEALHRATGETAQLCQWWGDEVIVSVWLEGTQADSVRGGYVGMVGPAYQTAVGKVLLAGLTDGRADAYVAKGHCGPFDHVAWAAPTNLRAELAAVRRAGYAVDRDSGGCGVCCIAAPLADPTGRARYALGISLPRGRFEAEEPGLVEAVLGIARVAAPTLRAGAAGAGLPGRRAGKAPLLPHSV